MKTSGCGVIHRAVVSTLAARPATGEDDSFVRFERAVRGDAVLALAQVKGAFDRTRGPRGAIRWTQRRGTFPSSQRIADARNPFARRARPAIAASDPAFMDHATRCVVRERFEPALTEQGTPVEEQVTMKMNFVR